MHRTILYILTSIICLFAATSYADAAVIIRPVFNFGLVGYWDFNEGEGNTAYDRSGNSNHGSLTNMQPQEDWVNSKSGLGQALEFDGSNDYVDFADIDNLSDVTISVWIFRNTLTAAKNIIGNNQNRGILVIDTFDANDLRFGIAAGGGNFGP